MNRIPFPSIATPRGTIPKLRLLWVQCFGHPTNAKA